MFGVIYVADGTDAAKETVDGRTNFYEHVGCWNGVVDFDILYLSRLANCATNQHHPTACSSLISNFAARIPTLAPETR